MKIKRKIIEIDETLCTGCGDCIPSCHEKALQIVDTPDGPKARLVKDLFCDGLGACLGTCPTGALQVVEREADPFDETAVAARIQSMDTPSPGAHTPQPQVGFACPSARSLTWSGEKDPGTRAAADPAPFEPRRSELRQWPVQIHLLPPAAPFMKDSDLSIVADCVPFAFPDLHKHVLRNRSVAIGCPKLDNAQAYVDKLTAIFTHTPPASIEVVIMQVPCCRGMLHVVQSALVRSGADIPLFHTVISIKGEILADRRPVGTDSW